MIFNKIIKSYVGRILGRNSRILVATHLRQNGANRYKGSDVQPWVKMEDKLRSDAKDKSFSIEKRKRVRKERVPKFPLVEKGVYEWYSIKFVMQAYVSLL